MLSKGAKTHVHPTQAVVDGSQKAKGCPCLSEGEPEPLARHLGEGSLAVKERGVWLSPTEPLYPTSLRFA